MITIMQGDAYDIPIDLLDSEGQTIDDRAVATVEVSVGELRKVVEFSSGCWLFPLTQQETLRLTPTSYTVQIRVKFPDGDVVGTTAGRIEVLLGTSREVL